MMQEVYTKGEEFCLKHREFCLTHSSSSKSPKALGAMLLVTNIAVVCIWQASRALTLLPSQASVCPIWWSRGGDPGVYKCLIVPGILVLCIHYLISPHSNLYSIHCLGVFYDWKLRISPQLQLGRLEPGFKPNSICLHAHSFSTAN